MIVPIISVVFALSICVSTEASEYDTAPHLIHVGYEDPDIPDDIEQAAVLYGMEYSICPEFIEAICHHESRFKAEVKSRDGKCIGLMQVNPSCHKGRMERLGVNKEDLLTVQGNIRVACDYLAELFGEYEDPVTVLMIYNGDSRWRQGKVSSYAKNILEMSQELEKKHGKT